MTTPIFSTTSSVTPSILPTSINSGETEASSSSSSSVAATKPNGPCFSDADHILWELQQAGICDDKGNPTPAFEKAAFPVLTSQDASNLAIFSSLQTFLHIPQLIKGRSLLKQDNPLFEISFTFFDLLNDLIQASSQPYGKDILPIEESELIGKYVIELLQAAPFIKACQTIFPQVSPEHIQKWFQKPFLLNYFAARAHDKDLRQITKGDLQRQVVLSSQTENFLVSRMQGFNPDLYRQYLQKKQANHPYLSLDLLDLKKAALIEFGNLTKRGPIASQDDQFAIWGAAIQDRSFELIFVGKQTTHPYQISLKDPCISSTNCWTFSLLPLLKTDSEHTITLKTGSFSPAKALIDLLSGTSTVLTANTKSWLRYLRDYNRSMQPGKEKEMLAHVFHNKTAYLARKSEKQKSPSNSHAFYLYLLLKEEILKVYKDPSTGLVNPSQALAFIFRACLSLQEHHPLSEKEIHSLWQLCDQNHLLDFGPSDPIFHRALKKVLLNEKIPFSLLSAWLGYAAWILSPSSLTHHEGKPVFCLSEPFAMRFAATPQTYYQTISKHSVFQSLKNLFKALLPHLKTICYPSPLQAHLPLLQVDSQAAAQQSQTWLADSDSFLNYLGAHLHLSVSSQVTKTDLNTLFHSLPSLLKEDLQKAWIPLLKTLASQLSLPAYATVLEDSSLSSPVSFSSWIDLLSQTKDPDLVELAYQIWKERIEKSLDTSKQKEMSWHLFHLFCACHPPRALSILQALHPQLTADERLEGLLVVSSAYQTLQVKMTQKDLLALSDGAHQLLTLTPALTFKDDKQKDDFVQLTNRLIMSLSQLPDQQDKTNELLLALSRRALSSARVWLKRLELFIKHPPASAHAIATLYYTALENKYLAGIDLKDSRLQQFKIDLGMLLLKEQHHQLSRKFLDELMQTPLQPTSLEPLYDFLSDVVKKAATQPLTADTLSLIKQLIQLTPEHKRQDTVWMMQTVCEGGIKSGSSTEAFDQQLTSFINNPLFKDFLQGWRPVAIAYLQATLPSATVKRLSLLSQLYEYTWNLSGEETERVSLIQTGVLLFKQLNKCQKSQPVDAFKAIVQSTDFFVIKTWIEALLKEADAACLAQAFAKLQTSWPLAIQAGETDFHKNAMLTSVRELFGLSLYQQAFECLQTTLSLINPCQLSETQWLAVAEVLQPKSAWNLSDQLLLSPVIQGFSVSSRQRLKPLAENEVKKRLDLSALTDKELETCFTFMTFYQLTEPSLWLRFLTLLSSSKNQELIDRVWTLFKEEEKVLASLPLQRAQCWTAMLNVLRQAHYKNLLKYANFLEPLFKDPLAQEEGLRAYQVILSSAIESLSPSQFKEKRFKNIQKAKQKIALSHSSLPAFDQWSFSLDRLLIQHLHDSTQPKCLLRLSNLLHSFFIHFDSKKEQYSCLLTSLEKVVSASLSHSSLTVITIKLMETLCTQQHIPSSSCLKILKGIKKQQVEYLPCSIKMINKMLQEGPLNGSSQHLKQVILTLMPAALKSLPKEQHHIIHEVIKRSSTPVSFKSDEKASLSDQVLDNYVMPSLTLQNMDSFIGLYQQWAPDLFVNPELLKKMLEKAVLLSSFALNCFQDSLKFESYIKAILNTANQIKGSPTLYFKWAFQTWKKHVSPAFSVTLILFLTNFVEEKIKTAAKQKIPPSEIVEWIQELIYLYPLHPHFKIAFTLYSKPTHECCQPTENILESDLKQLINVAYEHKIFDKHQDKLFEYISYLSMELPIVYPKDKFAFDLQTMDRFISYNTPTCLFKGMEVFHFLTRSLGFPDILPLKKMAEYCKKISNACAQHPPAIFKKHTLFSYLYVASCIPTERMPEKSKKCLATFIQIVRETLGHYIQYMDPDTSSDLQAHYTQLYLDLLYNQFHFHKVPTDEEAYFTSLKFIFPFILKVELKAPYGFDADLKIDVPEPGKLLSLFFELLEKSPNDKDFSHQQLTLAMEFIQTIKKIKAPYELPLAYECLLKTLNYFVETTFFTAKHKEAVQCFESAKTWLLAAEDTSHALQCEQLKLRLYASSLIKEDYGSYLKQIECLIEKTLETHFFLNEPAFIPRLSQLILQSPKPCHSDLLEMQTSTFLAFIRRIQNAFKAKLDEKNLQAAHVILHMMLQGACDQGVLKEENAASAAVFEQCIAWIDPPYQDRPLCRIAILIKLLQLDFYHKSRCEKEADAYKQELQLFMPRLHNYLVQTSDFDVSKRFFDLLNRSMDHPSQIWQLSIQWVTLLRRPKANPQQDEAFKQHAKELTQESSEKYLIIDSQDIENMIKFFQENATKDQ